MMSSYEALRANEELLERMQTARKSYSIYAPPQLEGRVLPNPSDHPDPRMSLSIGDMAKCYNPPQKPLKEISIVTKREHKSQAETEKDVSANS